MPEEKPSDPVERFLSEQESMEDRKQALIADLLKQKEAAVKSFDERLAKLGYRDNSKHKRSHHKKQTSASEASAQPKQKAKP